MESDKLAEVNQKIAEIKKRIMLVEGQRTAHTAEFEKQNRSNIERIASLKKEIKDLRVKCGRLLNPLQRPLIVKELPRESGNGETKRVTTLPAIMVGNVTYPIGAKNIDEAIFLTDLKITETRKQLDLVKHRYKCRKQYFDKLMQQHRELVANKEADDKYLAQRAPETIEEDNNRKLVQQLENEIHRTNVRLMEAEHVRKKYKSIEASLMNDAERFEKSLRELEAALNEQQKEINRLQKVHSEAIEMRDAAKAILQRQEQQAICSQKTRERQALDFRKQVEQRKLELERIGRKLFVENRPTLPHQDSISSSTGDPNTPKAENEDDETTQLVKELEKMDELFKDLMAVTGATTPQEVLERFSSQKESTLRLNYLRNTAEKEKAKLEALREHLAQELESSKFTDVKEQEVNQEVIDEIKSQILEHERETQKNVETVEKITKVIKFIKEHFIEMIFKMQEVDETDVELKNKGLTIGIKDLPNFLNNQAEESDIIEILMIKLEKCEELSRKRDEKTTYNLDLDISEEEFMQSLVPPKTPPILTETEKPPPMPICYYNILTGRTQRAVGTSSSSPEQAPAVSTAATEEENEVPSRNFLKRQSAIIVDQKSRRKPFRSAPNSRRK